MEGRRAGVDPILLDLAHFANAGEAARNGFGERLVLAWRTLAHNVLPTPRAFAAILACLRVRNRIPE